jgi:hypothetical protein
MPFSWQQQPLITVLYPCSIRFGDSFSIAGAFPHAVCLLVWCLCCVVWQLELQHCRKCVTHACRFVSLPCRRVFLLTPCFVKACVAALHSLQRMELFFMHCQT